MDKPSLKPLAQKLGLKPGASALVLRRPAGLMLEGWPDGPGGDAPTADHVLLFVTGVADLSAHAPGAIGACREGGHLWVAYPKTTGPIRTDITRDRGWEPLTQAGFLGVAQVAVDATWSALRFRRRHEIKTITRAGG